VTTLVAADGRRFGYEIARPTGTIIDSFDRADGPLGSDWIDGADYNPARYEPLGIHSGSVVCRLPLNRAAHGAVYAADQIPTPPPAGQQYLGIGCAWRETGLSHVSVTCRWAGLWDTNAGHHCEAAPLLYVKPGTPEHGIGVWTSELPFGPGPIWVPTLLVAALGNPPELFGVPAAGYPVLGIAGYTHTDGQSHDITMTGNGTTVSVAFDGVPVLLATLPIISHVDIRPA
jgi:hypothetical protein